MASNFPNPGQTVAAQAPGGEAQRFADADVPGRWWTLFRSPDLDRLVDRALSANPDLASAQAALRAARENHRADKGGLLPQVEADFNGSRQKNPVVLASPLANNANFYTLDTGQLSITYAPDLFGGVKRQIEASGAAAENQRFTLEATYLTLTTNVVTAALQMASLQAQIRATTAVIHSNELLLDGLTAQRRAGEAAAGDVAAAAATLAQARTILPPLEKQLAQARDQLAALLGQSPGDPASAPIDLDAVTLPTDLPLSVPSKLVEQRPDIRAAEANLHNASAMIGVAEAARLPTITLTGLLGGTSDRLSNLLASQNTLYSAAAGITQPIFEGGTLKHKQRAAEAAYDQAAAQYRSTVNVAFQNVADTLAALDQDARALQAAAEVQAATAQSLGVAARAFRLGETNRAAVINAQAADETALAALAQSRAARLTDTAALYQALGGGWWNRTDVAARSSGH